MPRIIASLACALVALGMIAEPSSAGVTHVYSSTITGTGSAELSGPIDVAVDQSSHDIYVTDVGNRRIVKFGPSGEFLLMFGKQVDQTTGGDVCTAASGHICKPGTAGTSSGAFERPAYVAVDNSGGPSNDDVYVADDTSRLVQKFDSTGHIISTWGVLGQKNGADAGPEEFRFTRILGLDVAATGELYLSGNGNSRITIYGQDGTFLGPAFTSGGTFQQPFFKVDAFQNMYTVAAISFTDYRVFKTNTLNESVGPVTSAFPTTGFAIDRSNGELYQDIGTEVAHYSGDCEPADGACNPIDSFGSGQLGGAQGIAIDEGNGTVYVAKTSENALIAFADVRPAAITGPPSEVSESSVTLTGHADPVEHGDIVACRFEYGFDKSYGRSVPCSPDPGSNPPLSDFTGPTDVTATLNNLSPGTQDHYRLVVTNAVGSTRAGADESFITTAPPSIPALSSANLTATSADLNAKVNPNGLETTYRFEYGTTPDYGSVAPIPDGSLPAGNSDQAIGTHLTGLTPHIVYHYRLVAENSDGVTTAEDHTFSFYPPACPNANVRQQTQTNFLPDCRAYELVSPGNAGGTQLYPGGPNTGYATSPSRLSFTGLFSTIPGSGGSPIDQNGDLYVATRTPTGWFTKYVGLPSSQAAVDGGPPQGLPGLGPGFRVTGNEDMANGSSFVDRIQRDVLTDPAMDKFVNWNDGNQESDLANPTPIASNGPYLWNVNGEFLDRWPTNLATVPAGIHVHMNPAGETVSTNPGGIHALDCPPISMGTNPNGAKLNPTLNLCPGDVNASSDLSHFVFSSQWNVFARGGQIGAPGSVYDNDVRSGSVSVISKTPSGATIPTEPGDAYGTTLHIPAISADGSHVLIAASGTGPCGKANCLVIPCGSDFVIARRCPEWASHLYMRVNDAVTYDVSKGRAVTYIGATEDGTKVYFTSDEQLVPEDEDTSTDLYMWFAESNELTLVSRGTGGSGNSDACNAAGTVKCGVTTFSARPFCYLAGGLGGNCRSDSFIASKTGDIYFLSPEQLDGTRGVPNQQNLYDYREGQVQYVATFTSGPFCAAEQCSATPIVRMQVSPDDSHMAMVTASPLTAYDNAGHLEMYRYTPAGRSVICVSCVLSGEPPTSDVRASENGLFMVNDGRTFFTTDDALVHGDTNRAIDVYEYVDGRPQLITLGTGETRERGGGSLFNPPGLVGVSADGTDAYFATLDTLVPQDHNGLFVKFYDARSSGGFPSPPPPPPCEAAAECHAETNGGPRPLREGTTAALPGGNAIRHHRAKQHRRPRHHRKARNGGSGKGRGAHGRTIGGGQGGSR